LIGSELCFGTRANRAHDALRVLVHGGHASDTNEPLRQWFFRS
jgi:hypothetical protein